MTAESPESPAADAPAGSRAGTAVPPDLAAIVVLGAVVAVVLGVVGAAAHPVGDYGVETDFFAELVPEARAWAAGDAPVGRFRGPLYPMLLAAVGAIAPTLFGAAKAIAAVAAGTLVVLAGVLGRRLYGPRAGLVAAALTAGSPVVVRFGFTVGTDAVFAALALGALVALVAPRRVSWPAVLAAGVLGGLAALTRYNGLVLLGALPVAAAIVADGSARRRVAMAASCAAAFVVTLVPWAMHTRAVAGRMLANDNHLNLAYTLYGDELGGWDAFWYGDGAAGFSGFGDVVLRDPMRFVGHVLGEIPAHLVGDAIHVATVPVAVLAVVGVALSIRARPSRREVATAVLGLALFGVLLLVFHRPRFSLPLAPLWAVAAGAAISRAVELHAGFARRAVVVAGAAFVAQLAIGVPPVARALEAEPREMLDIVRDARRLGVTGRVTARKPHIGYHLGLPWVAPPPPESFRDFVVWMVENDVEWLYMSRIEAMMWPPFEPLLDPAEAPPVLVPVASSASPPAVLYRVNAELVRAAMESEPAP